MSPLKLSLYICLVLTSVFVRCGESWTYEDLDHWSAEYPVCGTKTQSPIDFNPQTITWNDTIPFFGFHNYDAVLNLTTFSLTNNGHSVQMNIQEQNATDTPFWISGGGLPSNYTLTQFHFHWGEKNDQGSEHTVEEGAYPMELHLVHWDAVRRPTFSEASNTTDGLAVLGIFVQISETNSSVFDSLIKYFQNITFKDYTASSVTPFPLNQLLPTDTRDFYRYRGSLTTPPCYNSVVWTVFKQPITISQLQLEEFRTRLSENGPNDSKNPRLVDNYRATQDLNGRSVYKTFEKVEWSYGGTDEVADWKFLFPLCAGDDQSPIDIATTSTVENKSLPQFTFTNYRSTPSGTNFKLVNTGTSVDLVVTGAKSLTISGGGLSGNYVLEKVTLHWGEHNGQGSDHRLNGLAYPLEMQFLHYSSQYANSYSASFHTDGLAILSVFFQATPDDNPSLTPIWLKLGSVARPGNSTDVVDSLALSNWIPPRNMSFYRYPGSLTVPNCAQSVVWTVFTDQLSISAKQLNTLRSTVYGTGSTPLANNFRSPQNLNNRIVIRSVPITPIVSKASTKSSALEVLLFSVVFTATIKTTLRL